MQNNIKNWKAVTKGAYDNYAEQFASFSTIFRGKLKKWINYFSSKLPKRSSILDIGCGAGRDSLFFVNKGFSVTGIDFSEKIIEIVKKRVANGKFIVMDFENLSFPENNFDGIWACASLYHLPKENLMGVLKKINLVLKRGGLFFSLFRFGEGERFTKEKRGNAILERFGAYYYPKELEVLLVKSGFKDIKFELDNMDTGEWIGFFANK